MTWEERILAREADPVAAIETLFSQQAGSWELLARGMEGLARARSRVVTVAGHDLVAWHIPHRIQSTTAQVDQASIRDRPCFLCPENLPEAERAVALDDRYVVTCNPYPILERHLSVVSRAHRPQRIAGAGSDLQTMLRLSSALPDYLVLYNGPECGASAPDHMHFQACRREGVPIGKCLDEIAGGVIDGFPSNPLVVRGQDSAAIERVFLKVIDGLRAEVPGVDEPMLNIVTIYEGERWNVFVFPRVRHRPRIYHSGELTWTPGALDLTGVVVLPVSDDLERVDAEILSRGFTDVSLSREKVGNLARRLELA